MASNRKRIAPPARRDTFKRFLFNNGISLITLATIFMGAGEYKQRFINMERMAIVASAKADTISDKLSIVDIRLSAIDAEITNLKGRSHECRFAPR